MKEYLLASGQDLQVPLFFSLLALGLVLERIFPKRKPQTPQAKRKLTNTGLTIVNIAILPLLPASFISAALWAQNQGVGLLNELQFQLPWLALLLFTLLARGFISFGTHLLNHKIPLLWRFHQVHHLDTELDISSTVRFHPLEMTLSLVIGLPLVVALGLSPWVLVIYELFDVSVTLFSHSNLRIPKLINRYLAYLIVTPDLHRVHHSSHQPETDSNYSAVFPIWDIICGTYKTDTRTPIETMPLGLEIIRDFRTNRFWWLLAYPFLTRKLPLEVRPAH